MELAYLLIEISGEFRVLLKVLDAVIPALAKAFLAVGEPSSAFLDDFSIDRIIQQYPHLRYALPVNQIEFGGPEGRGHLVLDHLHLHPVPPHLVSLLDLGGLADIEPDSGVELERVPPSRRFRVSKHDPDFRAELVDEDEDRV